MEKLDVIIVGAGIIGLAIARQFALKGQTVGILESANTIGTMTSSRNSEVIHAGIYYPSNSLKAKLCMEGKSKLYKYLEQHKIRYEKTGKLIVATSKKELTILDSILEQAKKNGVNDLQLLQAKNAQELEPELQCCGAILSPSTGIVDSLALMEALRNDAIEHGAIISFDSHVDNLHKIQDGFVLDVKSKRTDNYQIQAGTVVNSCGLNSWELANNCLALKKHHIPNKHLAKGCYFSLSGTLPFSHLVYPVPMRGGLGIHYTLDLANKAKFGPNVIWIDKEDYSVDSRQEPNFRKAIKQYFPGIDHRTITADFSGIRPKISGPNEGNADFLIQTGKDHGIPGLINLFGMESPGLTASLAIADYVAKTSY